MKKHYKVIDDIVLDDESLRSDGLHQATEEELRIFWSTNSVYDADRLKLLGHMIIDVARYKKKN